MKINPAHALLASNMSQIREKAMPLEKRITGILESRRERLAGYQVLLFGSRGRGIASSNSDYDIGILGDTPLDLATYFEIKDAMDALPTLHTIDWVDLNRGSKDLRENAKKEGKLLYEG